MYVHLCGINAFHQFLPKKTYKYPPTCVVCVLALLGLRVCDSPGARITIEVKLTSVNTVFDENSKLKREEGKEAAKGVVHSKICRAWVNLGSINLANRGPTSADASPYPIRQHCSHSLSLDKHVTAEACTGAVTASPIAHGRKWRSRES
jgi:hypothetical protein